MFQTFILPTCMEGRMTSKLLLIQNDIFGFMKGMSLDVSFDSVLIHQTLRRHLYDKGKPNIKSVRARYQDGFLGGRDSFPPPPTRLSCSERQPLYTFLSFKVCTKLPKGKSIIVRITKSESKRVLGNCGLQSPNAGTLSSSSGRRAVYGTV